MRPILVRIPLAWWPDYAVWVILASLLLLGGYIAWRWIYQKKPFPVEAATVLLLLVGVSIYALAKPKSFPQSLPLYSYGFMLMVGFASAIWLTAYRAKKVGIDPEVIYDLAVYVVLAGIIGARLFYVYIESAHEFRGRPWWVVFQVWQGGLTFYGGFLGAAIASVVYIRLKKLDGLLLADLIAPSLMVGLGFGRIGCMLNGCCWGKPVSGETILPTITWKPGSLCYLVQQKTGLIPPGAAESLPVYFTQLYASVLAFTIAILVLLFSRYFQKRKGLAFALMLILYSSARFVMEYVRADNPPRYLGGTVTISQLVSMGGALFALALVAYSLWRNELVPWRKEPSEKKGEGADSS